MAGRGIGGGATKVGQWPKEEGSSGARGWRRWSKGEWEEKKGERGKTKGVGRVLSILPRSIGHTRGAPSVQTSSATLRPKHHGVSPQNRAKTHET